MINKASQKQTLVVILAMLAAPAAADPPAAWKSGQTFRDWHLECPAAACPAQTVVVGADGSEVLRVALKARPTAALTVTTVLPLFLPDGIVLGIGERPPLSAPWRTCGKAGCEATLPLDPELLEAVQRERGGSVTLTLVEGVKVRIPFSLLGVSAALAARGS
jgi:invasion protein IalB